MVDQGLAVTDSDGCQKDTWLELDADAWLELNTDACLELFTDALSLTLMLVCLELFTDACLFGAFHQCLIGWSFSLMLACFTPFH